MKKQTDTFKRLRAVIKDINGDNRQIIKTMQNQIEYLMEFIDIQGEILEEKTGSRQPELSVEQKKVYFTDLSCFAAFGGILQAGLFSRFAVLY